jgi:hypothetical protein
MHYRAVAEAMGAADVRAASGLLINADRYFRPLGEGVYGLTPLGEELATAPDANAAGGTLSPAPANGTPS